MKNLKTYFSIISAAVLVMSCSLDENPSHFVSRDQFYNTESECESAVNACYRNVKSIYVNQFLAITEATCDLFSSNSTGKTDFTLAVSPADPKFGANIWKNCYQGIMYCNECIACIGASHIKDEAKQRLICEATILRAFYYYILTNVFNGVPYYTEMVATQDDLARIRLLPRTDANEIRRLLYQDLETNVLPCYSEEKGNILRGSSVKEQRVGYAMALMLMAKFAMWYQDWDAALMPLRKLEALYGELTEANYPLEKTMWRYPNTDESIFEVQHAWSVSGVQFHSTVAPSMYPTPEQDGWFNGVYMPEIGTNVTKYNILTCTAHYAIFYTKTGKQPEENTSYSGAIMNPMPLTYDVYDATLNRYLVKLDLDAIAAGSIRGKKIDRRTLVSLGLGDLKTGATFTAVTKYGKPFCGPKFWCPDMVTYHDSNNYKVFRYADAVLMMAECFIQKGDVENALKYMNYTRARAAVDPLEGITDKDDLMAELRNERARELGGEMHRKFDLVRWGIWYNQTIQYNTTNAVLKNNIRPCHRYYPIPDTECALSGYILTNDEYNVD
ncbi:MAG: RagB/SusD family nutrient uptake outer membrane protein [Bacteroidales bacterium]|nr:RagB/SusD family nutrient uptake outer membrane protein [Bacteroidales bacterium]